MIDRLERRSIFLGAAVAAVGLTFGGAAGCVRSKEEEEEGVGAVEDLMREHGVIRRAILVYRESAAMLRAGKSVDLQPLHGTAMLIRTFAEDYHERALEEAYIFPAVQKAGRPQAPYIDILLAQHARGREITDYILSATEQGSVTTVDSERFAQVFEAFELMYANHTAREDTLVFPAWKKTLSESALHEMGEKFEEIEHKQFGEDGFDKAVEQIGQIETTLGFADLSQFTALPVT